MEFTVIIVSKPVRRCEAAFCSEVAVRPASTVQLLSSVAPFQLAYYVPVEKSQNSLSAR